uniref:Variant surface glycoprotein 1125.397 n=1 Tax=Trypanosoma brucei TaxID=5691 RepID=A0A1J0R4A4_9TRYP|nr:variant surface glycoprotein 1125.397 [Trypanosoma brucei]
MKSALVTWILLVLAHSLQTVEKAKATAGDTHADFLSLCHVYQAALVMAAVQPKMPAIGTTLTDLENYNMTAAAPEWQTIFDKTGSDAGWEGYIKRNSGVESKYNWAEQWPAWENARKQTKNPNAGWPKQNPRATKIKELQALRGFVNETANYAKQLASIATSPPATDNKPITAAIKDLVQEALCGPVATPKAGELDCNEPGTGKDKERDCTADNSGKGVLTNLVCLCFAQTGDQCTGTAVTGFTAAATAFVGNTLADTKSACGPINNKVDPATALTAALGAFSARLGNKKTDGTHKMVLGPTLSTDCTKTNSNCVDYTQRINGNNKGVTAIEWYQKLQEALKLHADLRKKESAAENAALQLLGLKAALERELERPFPVAVAPATSEDAEQQNKKITETDCTNLKTNATCAAANCKWHSTTEVKGEHCKPKEPKGQTDTAAGTGEGAAGTTANTTGSNSFVINKSPLLLAFLLF